MTTPDSTRPPSWLPQAVLVIALTLVSLTALGWILFTLRSLFGMVFIAGFLAVAFEPAVQRLSKRGWTRGKATWLVMGLSILVLAAVVLLVVPAFIRNFVELLGNLPTYIAALVIWLGQYVDVSSFDPTTIEVEGLGGIAGNVLGAIFSWGAGFVGAIGQAITILLFAYYLVAQGPAMRRVLFSFLPPARQREAQFVWEVSVEKTGSYFYSRLILGLIVGIYSLILFLVLGLPYAASMAVFVGVVSQLIPVIGTYIAMIVPAFVAFFEDPIKAVWVIVFLSAYQLVENLVLLPRITSKTMEIHPAVSIAAVIAGGALFGALGVFLSLPVTAIVQAIVSTYVHRYEVIPELAEEAHRGEKELEAVAREPFWQRWIPGQEEED